MIAPESCGDTLETALVASQPAALDQKSAQQPNNVFFTALLDCPQVLVTKLISRKLVANEVLRMLARRARYS